MWNCFVGKDYSVSIKFINIGLQGIFRIVQTKLNKKVTFFWQVADAECFLRRHDGEDLLSLSTLSIVYIVNKYVIRNSMLVRTTEELVSVIVGTREVKVFSVGYKAFSY